MHQSREAARKGRGNKKVIPTGKKQMEAHRLSSNALQMGFPLLGKKALPCLEVCRQVGAVFQQSLRRRIDGRCKCAIGLILS